MKFLLNKIIVVTLLCISGVFAQRRQEFKSPDGQVRAVVNNIFDEYGQHESKIHIFNSKGKTIFDTSFVSKDTQHGFGVIHTGWTADSRFFVFAIMSSGGHQPWHFPILAFYVPGHYVLDFDRLVGAVTSDFKLSPPDSLRTKILKNPKSTSEDKDVNIKLSDLIKKLN